MITRYRGRVSGPLLDRVDLHIGVPAILYREMASETPAESSASVRRRVLSARERQLARSAEFPSNTRLPTSLIKEHCRLDAAGRRLMEQAVGRLGLSARAHDRVLKVARTIADLEAEDRIGSRHLAEAIQYRQLDRSS